MYSVTIISQWRRSRFEVDNAVLYVYTSILIGSWVEVWYHTYI